MRAKRKYVLTIAGFDPSAGAGVLADIKTFEMNKVYGLGVIAANTFQDDQEFKRVEWIPVDRMLEQIDMMTSCFSLEYIKIGLIESFVVLEKVIEHCQQRVKDVRIIWDPILKASAGFNFHDPKENGALKNILPKLFLVTPNVPEALALSGRQLTSDAGTELAAACNVLIKGGHRAEKIGYDTLFLREGKQFSFRPKIRGVSEKHGSGCVLSAAIAANLAKGESVQRACLAGKEYTEKFLSSQPGLLGYHR